MFKLVLYIIVILILALIFYKFLANPPYFTEEFTNSHKNNKTNFVLPENNTNNNTNNSDNSSFPINNLVYDPNNSNNDINNLSFPDNNLVNSLPIDNLTYNPLSNNTNNSQSNKYHNYNHFTGNSSQLTPGTYYEKNGNVIRVSPLADGNMYLHEQKPNSPINNIYKPSSNSIYYGNNGSSARIVTLNGHTAIKVNTSNGNTYLYTQHPPVLSNSISSTQYFGSTGSTVPTNYDLAYTTSNNATNNYKTIFTGPNGAQAIVNDNNTITVTQNGQTTNFSSVNNSTSAFISNTGEKLNFVKQGNGVVLKLTETNGNIDIFINPWFSGDNVISSLYGSSNKQTNNSGINYKAIFMGPNGAQAMINNNNTITLMENGNATYFTPVNNSTTDFISSNGDRFTFVKQGNGEILKLTEPNGNVDTFTNPWLSGDNIISSSVGNNQSNYNLYSKFPFKSNLIENFNESPNSINSMNNSNKYSSIYPKGIPRNQIPPGEEDLYILKSEIIPPVCPACPPTTICGKKEPPPPCPPCARCPEPNMACKLVPNYEDDEYKNSFYKSKKHHYSTYRKSLPVPVLADYTTYGM